jgi:alkylresorcinol/alkylpyrone synthase
MGWNIVSEGMQVVFARRIPEIVKNYAYEDLTAFLSDNGLTFEDISNYIFHPGGVKVIEAYEKSLSMSNGDLHNSRDILKDYGNMSSVTVLFVLEKFLKERNGNNSYALMSALGPGFSAESLLLKT